MSVVVLVPGPLQPFSGGTSRVDLDRPATVSDALRELDRLHPGLSRRVIDETGAVRPHVNIFVGPDNIRDASGLQTRVPDGCEIAILPAVSGG